MPFVTVVRRHDQDPFGDLAGRDTQEGMPYRAPCDERAVN
jgi:hypothetical protein